METDIRKLTLKSEKLDEKADYLLKTCETSVSYQEESDDDTDAEEESRKKQRLKDSCKFIDSLSSILKD